MKASDSLPIEAQTVPESRSAFQRYGVAVGMLVLAFTIRLALDGWLDPKHPGSTGASLPKHVFITFIVATIIASWYGGFGPSVVTGAGGFVLGIWFFLPPRHTFQVSNFADTGAPPILVLLCIIFFGRAMQFAFRLYGPIFQAGFSPSVRRAARSSRSEERRVGKECRSRWSPYH